MRFSSFGNSLFIINKNVTIKHSSNHADIAINLNRKFNFEGLSTSFNERLFDFSYFTADKTSCITFIPKISFLQPNLVYRKSENENAYSISVPISIDDFLFTISETNERCINDMIYSIAYQPTFHNLDCNIHFIYSPRFFKDSIQHFKSYIVSLHHPNVSIGISKKKDVFQSKFMLRHLSCGLYGLFRSNLDPLSVIKAKIGVGFSSEPFSISVKSDFFRKIVSSKMVLEYPKGKLGIVYRHEKEENDYIVGLKHYISDSLMVKCLVQKPSIHVECKIDITRKVVIKLSYYLNFSSSIVPHFHGLELSLNH